MAWLRVSDNAWHHPYFSRLYELQEYREGLKLTLWGFLLACADYSAEHYTDYIIERGKIREIAGADWELLINVSLKTGFFECTMRDADGRIGYKLLDDPENFVHIVRKDEKEWTRGRDKDLRNTDLKGRVRMRDGDQCRWCGKIVHWHDRKGSTGGTYDHAIPGVVANGDIDKVYIACGTCNKSRQDRDDWEGKLRPAPVNPYYSESTAKQLADWGFIVEPSAKPLFVEVDPNSDESYAIPEGTAPLMKSESTLAWTPVEHTPVDPNPVEPERVAPGRTVPGDSVPVRDPQEIMAEFERSIQEQLLDTAPDFVKESVEATRQSSNAHTRPVDPALVEIASVEPERLDPEARAPKATAPGQAIQPPEKPKTPSQRAGVDIYVDIYDSAQIGAIADLDVPGRVGSGREETLSQENHPAPENHGTAIPKSRRRRRRRKGNGSKES